MKSVELVGKSIVWHTSIEGAGILLLFSKPLSWVGGLEKLTSFSIVESLDILLLGYNNEGIYYIALDKGVAKIIAEATGGQILVSMGDVEKRAPKEIFKIAVNRLGEEVFLDKKGQI